MLAAADFEGLATRAAEAAYGPRGGALLTEGSWLTLRQRVTSKGGTTHAAITSMQEAGVGPAFERAMQAAEQRARELGDEFGAAG